MAKASKRQTKRKKKKAPSLIRRSLSSLGGFVSHHPSWVGGPLVFAVVLSFVSANALWYQPGPHPEPLMKTRQPSDPYAVPGRKMASEENFETFRIEIEDDSEDGSVEVASLGNAAGVSGTGSGGGDDLMAILQAVETQAPPTPDDVSPSSSTVTTVESKTDVDRTTIRQVQEQLAAAGYYKGEPDGVTGPLTQSAVRAFQADQGIAETGIADERLLVVLKRDDRTLPPVPTPRAEVIPETQSADPVAEILNSTPAANPMIVEIQRGLVNIAYDDVTVDGVAGANTRSAILQFQKHYRLPETGEPSVAVRDKLAEIGAL